MAKTPEQAVSDPQNDAERPRLAALKQAWIDATDRDREDFSHWLVERTHQNWKEHAAQHEAGITTKLWMK